MSSEPPIAPMSDGALGVVLEVLSEVNGEAGPIPECSEHCVGRWIARRAAIRQSCTRHRGAGVCHSPHPRVSQGATALRAPGNETGRLAGGSTGYLKVHRVGTRIREVSA